MADSWEQFRGGFPAIITLPVQWGDQDAFGHVNNTVYLRWYESARIVYGAKVGLAQLKASHQIGPILAAVSCNYRRQVTYPDTVHIGARITKLGRSSMVMQHSVWSESQQAVVADGESTVVCFNYGDNKSCPIPPDLRAAIGQLEQRTDL